jgi:hypothetical protein
VDQGSEGAVRPVVVVVVLVCAQRCYGISQVDDQNAVEEFATDAAGGCPEVRGILVAAR